MWYALLWFAVIMQDATTNYCNSSKSESIWLLDILTTIKPLCTCECQLENSDQQIYRVTFRFVAFSSVCDALLFKA